MKRISGKLSPRTVGILIGLVVASIVWYLYSKGAISAANDSGYGAGVQNTLSDTGA